MVCGLASGPRSASWCSHVRLAVRVMGWARFRTTCLTPRGIFDYFIFILFLFFLLGKVNQEEIRFFGICTSVRCVIRYGRRETVDGCRSRGISSGRGLERNVSLVSKRSSSSSKETHLYTEQHHCSSPSPFPSLTSSVVPQLQLVS